MTEEDKKKLREGIEGLERPGPREMVQNVAVNAGSAALIMFIAIQVSKMSSSIPALAAALYKEGGPGESV